MNRGETIKLVNIPDPRKILAFPESEQAQKEYWDAVSLYLKLRDLFDPMMAAIAHLALWHDGDTSPTKYSQGKRAFHRNADYIPPVSGRGND